MKLRNIVIIIGIFLLTGCDAVYNLDISDNKIDESTNFHFLENDYHYDAYSPDIEMKYFDNMDELIDDVMNEDYLAFDKKYNNKVFYQKKRINSDSVIFMNTYSFDNFIHSYILNSCGKDVVFSNDKDSISLSAKIYYSCFGVDYGPHLNNLTINIKTDFTVLNHNADQVKGNTYTWFVKDVDYNKSIKMILEKDKNINFLSESNGLFTLSNFGVFMASFVVFLVLILIYFRFFTKKKH